MPKVFMPEVTGDERLIILKQNADRVEETIYQRPLSEDELTVRMQELAHNSIKLSDAEEEKKAAMQVFKEAIDPLKKLNANLILEIRTGQVKAEGNLYYMANYDDSMMEVYDDTGVLVTTRRLLPNERQGNLLRAIK